MILASAAMFGSYGVWSKIVGRGGFGVFFQGWTRSAIVLILLIPVLIAKRAWYVKKKDMKWVAVSMAFGAATQVPLYYAFIHSTIATASLIFYAAFLVTAYLVGRLFLGETITKVKMLSMLLAIIGLALIFNLSLAIFSFLALAMAAVNGVASGGEVSTTKKSTDKYSSLTVSFYIWLGIFVTHLPLSILTHETQWRPAFNEYWGAMLLYAVIGLAAFWLVIEGYRFVDASIGGLLGMLEVVFAVAYGLIFFNEHLTKTIVIGSALIILSAALPDLKNILDNRPQHPGEPIREM